MAKCKVLSKPDYELTLSSDEKEALEKLLAKLSPNYEKTHCGLSGEETDLIAALWRVLDKTNM